MAGQGGSPSCASDFAYLGRLLVHLEDLVDPDDGARGTHLSAQALECASRATLEWFRWQTLPACALGSASMLACWPCKQLATDRAEPTLAGLQGEDAFAPGPRPGTCMPTGTPPIMPSGLTSG